MTKHLTPPETPPNLPLKRGGTKKGKKSKAPLSQKQKLIRLVHVAKGKLGWDDGTYREALAVVTGKTSSTKCTVAELKRFVRHMESKGFKSLPQTLPQPLPEEGEKERKGTNGQKNHTLDKPNACKARQAQIDKIEALLADGGKPWAYAEAMAKRMYGVDALHWCDSKQLIGIITALIKQQRRDNK